MIRPVAMGPRSFTRTSTVRPFLRFVTRSRVPNGRVRCAAVSWRMSYISPLAVFCPWCCSPYQDACPVWTAGRTLSGGRTTSGGRITSGEGDTSGGGLLTEVGDDTQPATLSTRATPAIRQCSIEPLKVSITVPTRFGKPKQSTALRHWAGNGSRQLPNPGIKRMVLSASHGKFLPGGLERSHDHREILGAVTGRLGGGVEPLGQVREGQGSADGLRSLLHQVNVLHEKIQLHLRGEIAAHDHGAT